MRVTSITVSAQCKLPHPAADFASVSALVSLTAELGEAEDVAGSVKKLQAQADTLAEQFMEAKRERLSARARDEAAAARARTATAQRTADLAAKHAAAGGGF